MNEISMREFLSSVRISQPDGSMIPLKDYQIDLAIELRKLQDSGRQIVILKPRSTNRQRNLLEIVREYNTYLKGNQGASDERSVAKKLNSIPKPCNKNKHACQNTNKQ